MKRGDRYKFKTGETVTIEAVTDTTLIYNIQGKISQYIFKDHFLKHPHHATLIPPNTSTRPSAASTFMEMAHVSAKRATCDRKHVGAVLVRDGHVLMTGYNGSEAGAPHCDDVGHDIVKLADGKENCVRTLHAEMNVLAQCACHGIATKGATLYVNTFPCWICAKLILSAKIDNVIYDAEYNNDERVIAAFTRGKVTLVRFTA